MVHTTALFVERPSTGRATSKLIFPAHGWWSVQLQYLWKVLQLGGLHQNSYSPLGARRKAWLENTHFALWNFSRTGWGYTASSDIYYPVLLSWGLCFGSSKNSPEGAPMKSLPLNFLSSRTHQIWPRTYLSAMCYEGILNIDNFEGKL